MAVLACPSCGHTQKAPDALIGRTSKCLKCETPAQIVDRVPGSTTPRPSVASNVGKSLGVNANSGHYPNLNKYLRWSSTLAVIFLVLGAIMVIVFAGIMTITSLTFPGGQKIGGLAITAVLSSLLALIIYIGYVATMAGIEIVRVLVDIEQNTRRSG